jgi:hypothetical protein
MTLSGSTHRDAALGSLARRWIFPSDAIDPAFGPTHQAGHFGLEQEFDVGLAATRSIM